MSSTSLNTLLHGVRSGIGTFELMPPKTESKMTMEILLLPLLQLRDCPERLVTQVSLVASLESLYDIGGFELKVFRLPKEPFH